MDRFTLAQILLSRLDPETAHDLTLWALRHGLGPARAAPGDPMLAIRLWDRVFPNPLGLAAGFDKNAAAIGPMLDLGFGFVEVGSITPAPQPGNSKPRVFRLPEDPAAINRLGFPSEGLAAAAQRIGRWRAEARSVASKGLLGVNLGTNRDSVEAAADYAEGARVRAPLADYLALNVSSPNTPGLRALQGCDELVRIVERVRAAIEAVPPAARPPLVVKIAPDLESIAAVAMDWNLAGLIVGNTTIARPAGLVGRHRDQAGGLSGRPLFAPSTAVLAQIYRLTEGRVPLIGVGGVASAADAYAKIRAGASLVQLYTALVYRGPGLVAEIETGLAALLRRDGFANPTEAIGADHR